MHCSSDSTSRRRCEGNVLFDIVYKINKRLESIIHISPSAILERLRRHTDLRSANYEWTYTTHNRRSRPRRAPDPRSSELSQPQLDSERSNFDRALINRFLVIRGRGIHLVNCTINTYWGKLLYMAVVVRALHSTRIFPSFTMFSTTYHGDTYRVSNESLHLVNC